MKYKNENFDASKYSAQIFSLGYNLLLCEIGKIKVVSFDESHFESSDFRGKVWSPKNLAFTKIIPKKRISFSLLLGVSQEKVETAQIVFETVKASTVEDFLIQLREANGNEPLCLLQDNAPVHRESNCL